MTPSLTGRFQAIAAFCVESAIIAITIKPVLMFILETICKCVFTLQNYEEYNLFTWSISKEYFRILHNISLDGFKSQNCGEYNIFIWLISKEFFSDFTQISLDGFKLQNCEKYNLSIWSMSKWLFPNFTQYFIEWLQNCKIVKNIIYSFDQ